MDKKKQSALDIKMQALRNASGLISRGAAKGDQLERLGSETLNYAYQSIRKDSAEKIGLTNQIKKILLKRGEYGG